MKIGIIGAGLIGKTLAEKLSSVGHQIKIADAKGIDPIQSTARNVGAKAVSMTEIAEEIDLLIISIPLFAIPDLAASLKGKIGKDVVIVETTNYWPHRDGNIEGLGRGMVNSVWVQQHFDRPIVKAFSNINAYSFKMEGKPKGSTGRIALAVASDDRQSKELVLELIDTIGFDALDAGLLEDSWRQQPCSPAYCTDLTIDQLDAARKSAQRELLEEKQKLAFEKMQDFGDEYFTSLTSGEYPEGFVDYAVDIFRSINGLPERNN
ncbi:3-hydroxyisobutyrate dehydrogenase [Kaistella solincola]|uniref:3-hydroxyisobutyrate dehydrogenase n=1 Tax=Kaistella solincola TaxID=510955 RepID=A0ABR4ZNT4_9FLAO|nr:NAD(P)-binding domain-containing protein [Kaistella solincola]KIA82606.1 3-hydroxyisobutyrate dehydrogenase [Kaistella solincola]